MSLDEFPGLEISGIDIIVEACFLGDCGPFSDKFDLGEPSMPSLTNLFAFAFVALGMVLTPGPNMIYLISRSIIQGRVAVSFHSAASRSDLSSICCARRSA